MHSIVIADTSCFILLTKINEIDLLHKVYKSVYTTPEIAAEFKNELPDWVVIQRVKNNEILLSLEVELDKGEASAIALTHELPNAIVVLDDWGARKVATRLKITFTGTFGIIVRAKQNGIIPSVTSILEKVKQTNFRISDELIATILSEAGEL